MIFRLQLPQGADGGQISAISGFGPAFPQMVVGDAEVFHGKVFPLGAAHSIFCGFVGNRPVRFTRYLIAGVQPQKRFKGFPVFYPKNGIAKRRVLQLYMTVGDFRNKKSRLIQINGVLQMILRRIRQNCRLGLGFLYKETVFMDRIGNRSNKRKCGGLDALRVVDLRDLSFFRWEKAQLDRLV